ncbi:cytochrome b5 domain-containing protein [Clostridium sp. YIM B02551]|uniref:cytochrome b5 domain-containing protein n=1 Tax=Clostridium sp. YIM B02551 TaxID=2910679 RepID=UPI001EEC97C5|nr:cytochrome b5 domain-containing protein [Clostridium sp. YIM B02551]
MNYFVPFGNPFNHSSFDEIGKSYRSVEEVLVIIEKSFDNQQEDEIAYNYLMALSQTEEEKSILISIRDDNLKHDGFLREIYAFYKKQCAPMLRSSDCTYSEAYIPQIKKARLSEMENVYRYRNIMTGLTDKYYRDMMLEALTDCIIHLSKYDYILYLNLERNLSSRKKLRQIKEFTLEELSRYDGSNGNPAYAAVNGIVYDLSNEASWGGGTHFGLTAGMDLTLHFEKCHSTPPILSKLPKVGILKS